MDKLTKTAKTLDNVFHILYVLLKIGAISCLVGIAIVAAYFLFDLKPEQVGTGYENLELGFLKLRLAEGFAPDKSFVILTAAVEMLLAFGCFAAGRSGVRCVRSILQPMANGEPFSSSVGTNLKKLTALSVVLGVAVNAVGLIEHCIWIFGYRVHDLLLSEKITHVTFDYEFDLSFLVIAAVLLLLTYVFRYGEQLQQLSDETL